MSEDPAADIPGDRDPKSPERGPRVVEDVSAALSHRRVIHGSVTVDVADGRAGGKEAEDDCPGILDLERWGRLAAAAAHDEGIRQTAEMGLAFVDEAEISELAGRWLHNDHPTDVLAFPVEECPGRAGQLGDNHGPPLLVGDVVVCPSVAARQAAEAGRPTEDELALLVVHGVLHLLGHDHARPVEARRMERRTRVLLARHHGS